MNKISMLTLLIIAALGIKQLTQEGCSPKHSASPTSDGTTPSTDGTTSTYDVSTTTTNVWPATHVWLWSTTHVWSPYVWATHVPTACLCSTGSPAAAVKRWQQYRFCSFKINNFKLLANLKLQRDRKKEEEEEEEAFLFCRVKIIDPKFDFLIDSLLF
eukprot:TCONS_00040716-protein